MSGSLPIVCTKIYINVIYCNCNFSYFLVCFAIVEYSRHNSLQTIEISSNSLSPKARRQRKTTTLKYLYEIAAIPDSKRAELLGNLMKRKNAGDQVNVKLLRLIYEHVNENKILQWDDDSICTGLGISRDMLYCHKSWLLKKLRMLYFGWEKKDSKADKVNRKRFLGLVTAETEEAKKMLDAGMRKESKLMLRSIEKKMLSKTRLSIKEKELFVAVSRYLCQYYYNLKKENSFNRYYYQTISVYRSLLRSCRLNNRKVALDARIHYYYCLSYKPTYNGKKIEEFVKARGYLEKALELSRESGDILKQSELIINIANFYSVEASSFGKAIETINEGMKLAANRNLQSDIYCYKILGIFYGFITQKAGIKETIEQLKLYYSSFEKSNPRTSLVRIVLMKAVFLASSYSDNNMLNDFFRKLYRFEILNYGYNSSFRTMYSSRFSMYLEDLFIPCLIRSTQGEEFVFSNSLNNEVKKKMLIAFDEILVNFHRITDVYFIKEIYTYMLLVTFVNADEFDPDQCGYFIKRIEWLNRSRGKIVTEANHILFEFLRQFVKMRSDKRYLSKEDFLQKYLLLFRGKTAELASGEIFTPLMYFVICHSAKLAGYGEFTDVVAELHKSILEKHPGFFYSYKTLRSGSS